MNSELIVYALSVIDQLIWIKDRHRGELSVDEIDTLNHACNLIEHNINQLENK